MIQPVYIVSAQRTPIGSFMGELASIPAPQLGVHAIKAALTTIALDGNEVDQVFMGNVLQAGIGQAPARQAALLSGLPNTIPATTINKVCSSGMKSVIIAAQTIALGDADIVVAGGMENMSLAPHLTQIRGHKFGPTNLEDSIQKDGLIDGLQSTIMGVFADQCADKHGITREAQDEFAITSYRRSEEAWKNGAFKSETTPITVKHRKGDKTIEQDEEFNKIVFDKISKLKPTFSKDGTVTAANASTINDGAAALVLMSEKKMKALKLKPLAKISSYADAAHEPEWFTTAPAKAIPLAVEKANLKLDDIDLIEINEAFSVVTLANAKLLNLPLEKININGGAVSLGHPIGCSGARILVTLTHLLQNQSKQYGVAGICNGGGGASAMVLER